LFISVVSSTQVGVQDHDHATCISEVHQWYGTHIVRFQQVRDPKAIAQIPGGSLDPVAVPKFQTPLLIPP